MIGRFSVPILATFHVLAYVGTVFIPGGDHRNSSATAAAMVHARSSAPDAAIACARPQMLNPVATRAGQSKLTDLREPARS